MHDVSAYGMVIMVRSTMTFPGGFPITNFADDADPFDIPETTIVETAMNVNGEMVSWTVASPTTINISVVPGSQADVALSIMLNANRAAMLKPPVKDVITMVAMYPNGEVVTASGGKIVSGPAASSPASNGKMKSKAYGFTFQNIVGTRG